jgi:hypothetical protein
MMLPLPLPLPVTSLGEQMQETPWLEKLNEVRKSGSWESLVFRDKKGRLQGNRHTICVLLNFHPQLQNISYNEERQEISHPTGFPWGGTTMQPHQRTQIAIWCAEVLGTIKGFAPARTWRDLVSAAKCRMEKS